MKLSTILLLGAPALFLRAMANPITLDPASTTETQPGDDDDDSQFPALWPADNDTFNSTESSLKSRCSWNDGHGPIHCDYFSVVIPYAWSQTGPFKEEFDIKGFNFAVKRSIHCGRANQWQSFTSPLPWVLQIHPGNTCHYNPQGMWSDFDNTWIRYSNQFLNTPTDSRCGRVGSGNRDMRCIIKQRS
ncbi:hypothetical protein QBC34DRAFT_428722 [Podospora aff. communis PSN243]|uniref:Ecp2 effector protein domain-containing protein n=1 Tax=Podospora aff. communis PSN243 TaxID=3040156 RepID=A0AAV9GEV2_9PEZI|nr:hypothetical protein QBC34DRAFT_428722 [Podospora aff. communis PSN243]